MTNNTDLDAAEAAVDWLYPTRRVGNCLLINGDCADVLAAMAEGCISAVVTDPPYGLSKEPDMSVVLAAWVSGDDYRHGSAGFMGAEWDSFVPGPALWSEVVRTMKPGAHLLSFAGSRTYDLLAVAIRLAELEIRDQVLWVYGSGFPKSHNISKAIDKAAGAVITAAATDDVKTWEGWGTALKPAHEPIVLARKPLRGTVAANVLAHGTGAINIDGCRIAGEPWTRPGSNAVDGVYGDYKNDTARTNDAGRFPANLIHDGSPEVVEHFPHDSARFFYTAKPSSWERDIGLDHLDAQVWYQYQTGNGASGKPSSLSNGRSTERRNVHPTVKPVAVMRYLLRLITAPGGVVLDPFLGSGTTGMAATLEGVPMIGIERDPAYFEIACARIAAVVADPDGIEKRLTKRGKT